MLHHVRSWIVSIQEESTKTESKNTIKNSRKRRTETQTQSPADDYHTSPQASKTPKQTRKPHNGIAGVNCWTDVATIDGGAGLFVVSIGGMGKEGRIRT